MMQQRSILHLDVLSHFFRPRGGYAELDYLRELARVRVPTLMLHGELDPIVPVELARATFNAFPAGCATLHVFPDCAHDMSQDAWPEAAAHIRQFIRSHAHAGG